MNANNSSKRSDHDNLNRLFGIPPNGWLIRLALAIGCGLKKVRIRGIARLMYVSGEGSKQCTVLSGKVLRR